MTYNSLALNGQRPPATMLTTLQVPAIIGLGNDVGVVSFVAANDPYLC